MPAPADPGPADPGPPRPRPADFGPARGDAGALKRRSVHGAAASLGAQGLRFVLQFGSQIVLARLLLPGDFGLVAMAAPLLGFVQIFNDLGLTQATVQRDNIGQRDLSALFWVNVALSVLLAAAVCLAAPAVASFYGEPRLVPVAVCLAGLLVLSGLSAQHMALMTRQMRFTALAAIDLACLVAAVGVGVGAAWLGLGYWSLVLMQAANSATIAALSWALSGWRPSRPGGVRDAASLLRFGGHVTGYNLLGYLESNLAGILIGALDGRHALGLYDRAQRLIYTPVWHLGAPVARVAVALLSRLRDSGPGYARAYARMLQGLLLATAPGFVCTAMVSETLVPALFGPAWSDAAPVVAWLAVAAAFAPFGMSASWLFVSQGRVRAQMAYGAAKAAVTVSALLVGLPWGVVGIARSYAAFAVLSQGCMVWGATRRGAVGRRDVVRAAYPVALGALAAAAALHLGERHTAAPGSSVAARLAADYALSYAACGLALLCSPGGLHLLRGLWGLRSTFRRAPAAG